ncbi:hypothetical protein Enr13x_32870 [Stieleria neptunia]|uniref:Uncharacterized protein n=1 Tax=Stieleria neptunia TaxID=2527979 RepID=A0A518HRE8_9BACT|nr:hypothetical protein Enr13x_32870 [Stieleria neptunia]
MLLILSSQRFHPMAKRAQRPPNPLLTNQSTGSIGYSWSVARFIRCFPPTEMAEIWGAEKWVGCRKEDKKMGDKKIRHGEIGASGR